MKLLNVSVLLITLVCTFSARAQDNWKLSVEKDDIKVYTRPIVDSKINAIKVEFNLAASQEQFIALLMDIDHSDEWLYHCKSSRVIKRVSPNELYYYTEVNVPWPAKNRDFVSHLILNRNPKTKITTIDAPAINGMVPEQDNMVRITRSSSRWTIIQISAKNIKINYELEVDPAGSIPAWLVNLFATQGPIQTFQKLKVQIEKPEYKQMSDPS